MFGLFNLFGRAPELKALDHALREAGLHPQTVPEAVKLTAVRLLKEANAGASLSGAAYAEAAQLLGFCMLGRERQRPPGGRSVQLNQPCRGAARRPPA